MSQSSTDADEGALVLVRKDKLEQLINANRVYKETVEHWVRAYAEESVLADKLRSLYTQKDELLNRVAAQSADQASQNVLLMVRLKRKDVILQHTTRNANNNKKRLRRNYVTARLLRSIRAACAIQRVWRRYWYEPYDYLGGTIPVSRAAERAFEKAHAEL